MSRRLIRVAELLRGELGRLISRERTLEGYLVTVTGVEVSPDLKQAFIYVSSLNLKVEHESIINALNEMRQDWQREIGKNMRTKFTPRLVFRYDNAQERGDRIMNLLNGLDMPEPPDSKT